MHPPSAIDWTIIIFYFGVTLAVGLRLSKRAGQSSSDFFVSGRSLPWWLAGTSMVATTFAADTPLWVAGKVAAQGISANWLWWSFLPSGLLTVFFFAAMWRRAGIVTDAEFAALRYAGPPANALRGFRAIYFGVLVNGVILGWVNLAMVKVLSLTLGLEEGWALAVCLGITFAYSALSGLWGIVVTDFVQFLVGMAGSIVLAWFALDAVGGVTGLREALAGASRPVDPAKGYGSVEDVLAFWPGTADWTLPVTTLAVLLTLNWWANWYPGSEPGGGGYVAQRMFATKNERHAMLAGLWFNFANYALRPWPWIVVGLCGAALYGNSMRNAEGNPDPELNYVQAMNELLPDGFRGLMLVAFGAAFMSTISTQINWGASYLVNDLYRPFVNSDASPRHYVRVARWATLLILGVSVVIYDFMDTVGQAWKLLIGMGAGTGLVLILRWFWWRINAWSEIASMVAAGTSYMTLGIWYDDGDPEQYAMKLVATFGITTATWLIVTFRTAPESEETLRAFCDRVRPGGAGWRRFATHPTPLHVRPRLLAWLAGLGLVYGALFGIGHLILQRPMPAAICLGVAAASGLALRVFLRHPAFANVDENA